MLIYFLHYNFRRKLVFSGDIEIFFILYIYFSTAYVAAMGKAGGGRNEVDPRFMSLFSVYNMTFPTNEVLEHIFTSIFHAHVHHYPFSDAIREMVTPVVHACLELFEVSNLF